MHGAMWLLVISIMLSLAVAGPISWLDAGVGDIHRVRIHGEIRPTPPAEDPQGAADDDGGDDVIQADME